MAIDQRRSEADAAQDFALEFCCSRSHIDLLRSLDVAVERYDNDTGYDFMCTDAEIIGASRCLLREVLDLLRQCANDPGRSAANRAMAQHYAEEIERLGKNLW